MVKSELTQNDVIRLVKEVFHDKVDLKVLLAVPPRPANESQGSEHTCWYLSNVLVLRAKDLVCSSRSQDALQHDEYKVLEQEAKLKDLIRGNALRAHPRSLAKIAAAIPATVAVGTWRKEDAPNWSTCEDVLFSIEEQKHGTCLDPNPQSTKSHMTLQRKIGSDTAEELCDLLKVLRTPALVEAARESSLPVHEPIELPLLVQQSRKALNALIEQSPLNNEHGDEEYTSWQTQLDQDAAWKFCKEIANIVQKSGHPGEIHDSDDDETAVLHADLKGEHILENKGSLSGILDWSDAAIGPGFIDIAGLIICVGAVLAVQLALRAGYTLSSCSRGVLFARSRCVLYLHQHEGPRWLLLRQARRAFQSANDIARE